MIRIQSEGGVERRITPIFVCDVCNEPITDVGAGAAVFRDRGQGEDELHIVKHVHKGDCYNRAEAQLVGRPGSRVA